jgi:competence protein ComEC
LKILLFVSFLFGFFLLNSHAANLQVVVLDVGMGQSVLLVEDGHGILVDTGLAGYSPHVLSRMKHYGVNSLDYLVLSHLHPDHAGGYFEIRAAWPDTPVFDSCSVPRELHPSEQSAFFVLQEGLKKDPLRSCLKAGGGLHWQGHNLQVLWPLPEPGVNLNRDSMVLLFTAKQGGTLLIMGDVDKSVERSIQADLEVSMKRQRVDLFVAGHHAAVDSTDPGFLKMLHPQVSIVSVGEDNPFGYPSKESMATLAKYSETLLRTDLNGEICFKLILEKVAPCTVLY